jgi:ATPase subunit of ABC transporter with duplicated ATPase domains
MHFALNGENATENQLHSHRQSLLEAYGNPRTSMLLVIFGNSKTQWGGNKLSRKVDIGYRFQEIAIEANKALKTVMEEILTDISKFLSDFSKAVPSGCDIAGIESVFKASVEKIQATLLLHEKRSVTVMVIGATNAGKSTFLNTLLRNPMVPMSDQPSTSILFRINHAPRTCTLKNENDSSYPLCEGEGCESEVLDKLLDIEALNRNSNLDACTAGAEMAPSVFSLDYQLPQFGILPYNVTFYDTPGKKQLLTDRIKRSDIRQHF